MKKILSILKRIWILNFFRRILFASTYFNKKYGQIVQWGFSSNEDTNYTYDLSEANILYLAHTIAVVTGDQVENILRYIGEIQQDELLKRDIAEATQKSSFRKFADLEVRYGKRVGWYAFVRALKPKVVIETGVDKGLGSVVLCAALLQNKQEGFEGKYYGTDINPDAGYLMTERYQAVGEILYGDSIQSLSALKQHIDLFINDSDHSKEYEYQEYLTIRPNISDKTIILGDNSHTSDKLALFSTETKRSFLFFAEQPTNHWYPGGGIGISYVSA